MTFFVNCSYILPKIYIAKCSMPKCEIYMVGYVYGNIPSIDIHVSYFTTLPMVIALVFAKVHCENSLQAGSLCV